MVYYKNYEQLSGRTLEENDKVVFTNENGNSYEYYVHNTHMNNRTTSNNARIFDYLKCGNGGRYAFASDAVGYDITCGEFPNYRHRDFDACTKIALAIFEELEGIDTSDRTAESISCYAQIDGKKISITKLKTEIDAKTLEVRELKKTLKSALKAFEEVVESNKPAKKKAKKSKK
jgi:hypothetical protein